MIANTLPLSHDWDTLCPSLLKAAQAVQRQQEPRDLLGTCWLLWQEALDSWDPDRGASLKTWACGKVYYHFQEERRKEMLAQKRYLPAESLDAFPADPSFVLETFLQDLSEDAREVALLVLETPLDILAELRQLRVPKKKTFRNLLREFLSEAGWGTGRIREAFDEIREALL